MLSTANSANVWFPPVVQLFAPPANPATTKIPFINSEKIIVGVNWIRIESDPDRSDLHSPRPRGRL